MNLFFVVVGILLAGGLAALLPGRRPRLATLCGAGSCVLACGLGLVPAIEVLRRGWPMTHRADWPVPYGSFFLEIDCLSAFFLVPILVLSGLAAIYGSEYMLSYRHQHHLGKPWALYNLLVASMLLVTTARNAVLFLVAWEVMALASFFLVTFEHEKEQVRRAGWTYLVATHIGTGFLTLMFVVMGSKAGSMDFDRFAHAAGPIAAAADALFVCAVIGFGTKAGFLPLHVWLPEAHPAAPSHVSAVMSGVMIKTGIYGLLRVLTYLGTPQAWWGWLLVGVGLLSGVLGILFALAQHDLKRILAYSSVENVGIITLSVGLGLLGICNDQPLIAVLGLAGALLHVVNHAMFKGLLFLGAGAVLHGTGTLAVDKLGGLLKRMPTVALTFTIGAAAICALPPLNGFAGEFLVYSGALRGAAGGSLSTALPSLLIIAGLAAIGGVAAACFAKAVGATFLGEPRGPHAAHVHGPSIMMTAPMVILMAACICLGLFAPLIVPQLTGVLVDLTGMPAESIEVGLSIAAGNLSLVVAIGLTLLLAVVLLTVVRARLLAGRTVEQAGTWDCGYAAPTPRMQYTGSSFAQPLVQLLRPFLRTRVQLDPPRGYFPSEGRLRTSTPDVFAEEIYRPALTGIGWAASKLRWLQQGRVQLYVLYIAVTLVVLLIWKLG